MSFEARKHAAVGLKVDNFYALLKPLNYYQFFIKIYSSRQEDSHVRFC